MIYVFMGHTNTGKTTLAQILSIELQIPIIKTYTTRPKRINEQDDVYHFVSDDFFDKENMNFLETKSYRVVTGDIWKYGTHKSSIDINKESIIVLDVSGYEALIREYGKEGITVFYIQSNRDILISRALQRGDDILEIKRRLYEDYEKFHHFIITNDVYKINNNDDINYPVKIIKDIILGLRLRY